MDALTPIAWAIDPKVTVRPHPDKTQIETHAAQKIINPFDTIALEEAIKWQEKGKIEHVTAPHIGLGTQGLRQALAMGSEQAVLLKTDQTLYPLGIAKTLAAWLKANPTHQLVIMGKQSSDDDQAQTGLMLSALMR